MYIVHNKNRYIIEKAIEYALYSMSVYCRTRSCSATDTGMLEQRYVLHHQLNFRIILMVVQVCTDGTARWIELGKQVGFVFVKVWWSLKSVEMNWTVL